jgi:pyridoxine 4-dehydrogenase
LPRGSRPKPFNIAKHDEVTVLDACTANGIAFAPFFPLGGGRTDLNDERLAMVAARHDTTVSQIALAWLLALSSVTLSISGTGSLTHLEENIAAGSITLTQEDLADLA